MDAAGRVLNPHAEYVDADGDPIAHEDPALLVAYVDTLQAVRRDSWDMLYVRIRAGELNSDQAREALARLATGHTDELVALVDRTGAVVFSGSGSDDDVRAEFAKTLHVRRVW